MLLQQLSAGQGAGRGSSTTTHACTHDDRGIHLKLTGPQGLGVHDRGLWAAAMNFTHHQVSAVSSAGVNAFCAGRRFLPPPPRICHPPAPRCAEPPAIP